MKLILLKLYREMFENKTQTLFTMVAMLIGISVFGAVLVCYSVVSRDLPRMHKEANGHSFIIESESEVDRIVEVLEVSEAVRTFEKTAHYRIRAKGENQGSHTMDLYAFENLSNVTVDTFTLEHGTLPSTSEIMVETQCLEVANVSLGDKMLVTSSSGDLVPLELTADVHDISKHPARYHREVYGYVQMATLNQLGYGANQINIIVSGDSYNRINVETKAQAIEASLIAYGITHYEIRMPEFLGTSPHAHEYIPVITVLQILGFVVYILATFTIINMISGMLARQTKQIGIMKAIGGIGSKLFPVYMVLVASLSGLCLLISGPLSLWLGQYLASFLFGLGNYKMINATIPTGTLVLILGASFIVPLLFSFYPVLRSCRIKVKDAINDYGIRDDDLNVHALKRFGGPLNLLPIRARGAVRHLWKKRSSMIVMMVMLCMGGCMYICSLLVSDAMMDAADAASRNIRYDIAFGYDMNSENNMAPLVDDIEAMSFVRDVEHWQGLSAYSLALDGTTIGLETLIAPTDNSQLYKPMIQEGRWFEESDNNTVVLSRSQLSGETNFVVGDIVSFDYGNGTLPLEVVGIVSEIGTRLHYVKSDILEQIGYNFYTLRLKDDTDEGISSAYGALETMYGNKNSNMHSYITPTKAIRDFETNNQDLLNFFRAMALMMMVISGVGVISTMSIDVLGRIKEYGVFQSIGGTKSHVREAIFVEILVIGIVSFLVTAVVTLLFSISIGAMFGELMFGIEMMFVQSMSHYVQFATIVGVIVTVCCTITSKIITGQPIKKALSYE